MSAIWLLSTKGRPIWCQEVLDACEKSQMTSQGIVWVDGDSYPELRLPENWQKIEAPWGGLRAGMQWCLKEFPKASQYGWLADDTHPVTEGWDKLVEEAAGSSYLAYCRDGWLSDNWLARPFLEIGEDLGGGLCWGGDLIRKVGWWAPPKLRQGGIDYVWTRLLSGLGMTRYLDDVTVLHKSWRCGARAKDGIDVLPHIDEDVQWAFAYVSSPGFRRIRKRLETAT
jgi:hypothetical protein